MDNNDAPATLIEIYEEYGLFENDGEINLADLFDLQ